MPIKAPSHLIAAASLSINTLNTALIYIIAGASTVITTFFRLIHEVTNT